MENRNTPGYISEKSALALLGGAVPIVWGCAELGQLYKPGSIINISHCATGDVEAAFYYLSSLFTLLCALWYIRG